MTNKKSMIARIDKRNLQPGQGLIEFAIIAVILAIVIIVLWPVLVSLYQMVQTMLASIGGV